MRELEEWLTAFQSENSSPGASGVEELFLRDGYWRDALSFTWDLRTFSGREEILKAWQGSAVAGAKFAINMDSIAGTRRGQSVEGFFHFDTKIARNRGYLRLRKDELGGWRAYTLMTSMLDLHGAEEQAGDFRPIYPEDSIAPEPRTNIRAYGRGAPPSPQALIIGAGQSGLSISARLQQLGITNLVVERNGRVGDNWRNRYQSLMLHNEVWTNHLPHLPFPDTYPVYLNKNQLADWLELYADALNLNVATSTSVGSISYRDDSESWEVEVEASGDVTQLTPRHVILATGVFGPPRTLSFPGEDAYQGTLMHASTYDGIQLSDAGPNARALVIGSGASAHDTAEELYRQGVEVTMLQRSTTCVVSLASAATVHAAYLDSELTIDDIDLRSNSVPLKLLAEMHKRITRQSAERDVELLEGLEAAGFGLDFGEDGSGYLMKFFRRGGGYYINTGCSELIAERKIAVKQGVEVERLDETLVHFTDGSAEAYDAVIVAVGYENMLSTVENIFGPEIGNKVGEVWGLDDEGEIRNMWKRTGQPGLWIMGGSLQQSRAYSKYLALQILGSELGLLSTNGVYDEAAKQ